MAPVATAAALADAPVALAGTSAVRATSSTDRPAAGAPRPPRAPAPLPPLRPSVTGVGVPPLGGTRPHRSPLPPPPPPTTTNSPGSSGERAPVAPQPELLTLLLPALPSPDPLLLPARGPLLLSSLHDAGDRSGSRRGRVRPRGVHGHPLLKNDCQDRIGVPQGNEERRRAYSPPGHRGA
jgi:hypothetical protein